MPASKFNSFCIHFNLSVVRVDVCGLEGFMCEDLCWKNRSSSVITKAAHRPIGFGRG